MYETISNYQLVEKMLAELSGDLNGPWNSYPCLNWPRGKQKGYGAVYLPGKMGKMGRAHRISFEKTKGPIPAGIDVCHHCDNPACFHPAHLFLGARKDNMDDCRKKGRSTKGRPSPATTGEKNPFSKLTDENVLEIRALYQKRKAVKEEIEALPKRFGIDKTHVWRIGTGKAWTHI